MKTYDRAPLYMVYIPSYASRESVVRRSNELLTNGLDSYVVVGGGFDNAISVSVFESVESAKLLLIRLGDSVNGLRVGELPRKGSEYWLPIKAFKGLGQSEVR